MVFLKCLFGVFLFLGVAAEDHDQLLDRNKENVVELTTQAGQIAELLRNIVMLAKISFEDGLKPEDLDFELPATDGWEKTTRDFLDSLDKSYEAFRAVYSEFVENQHKFISRFETKPNSDDPAATLENTSSVLLKRNLGINVPNYSNELDSTKEHLHIAEAELNKELERYIASQFGDEAMAIFAFESSTEIPEEQNFLDSSEETLADTTEYNSNFSKRYGYEPTTESTDNQKNPDPDNLDSVMELPNRYGMLSETYDSPSVVPVVGVRGKDFPDYTYIPETNFICSDKEYIPGFYADIKSRCQVFHICWPDRVKSYLCPIGTTFNQRTLSCDYWYNSVCSHSPRFYFLNQDLPQRPPIDGHPDVSRESSLPHRRMKFLPVRAKTSYYSDTEYDSGYPDDQDFEDYDSESSYPRYERRPRYRRETSNILSLAQKIHDLSEVSSTTESVPEKDYILRKIKLEAQKLRDFSMQKLDRDNGLAYDPDMAKIKTDRNNGLAYDPDFDRVKLDRNNGLAYDHDLDTVKMDRGNGLAYDPDFDIIKTDRNNGLAYDHDWSKIKLNRDNGLAYDSDMDTVKIDRNNGLAYDPDFDTVKTDRNNGLAYDPDLTKVKLDRDNGLAYEKFLDRIKMNRDNGLAYDPDLSKIKLDRGSGLAYDVDLDEVKIDNNQGYYSYLSKVKLDRNNGLAYSSQEHDHKDEKLKPKRLGLETAREELFGSSTESQAVENVSEVSETMPQKTENKNSDKFQPEFEMNSQSSFRELKSESPDSVSEETEILKVIKKPKSFKIKTYSARHDMAPEIVSKVFDAAENIVVKSLMPLTKQLLAANYVKVHKKKHN